MSELLCQLCYLSFCHAIWVCWKVLLLPLHCYRGRWCGGRATPSLPWSWAMDFWCPVVACTLQMHRETRDLHSKVAYLHAASHRIHASVVRDPLRSHIGLGLVCLYPSSADCQVSHTFVNPACLNAKGLSDRQLCEAHHEDA